MLRDQVFVFIAVAFFLFAVGMTAYLYYCAFKIAGVAPQTKDRVRLFWGMLWTPFWRISNDSIIRAQGAEFRAYVARIEKIKYTFIAGSVSFIVLMMLEAKFARWLGYN